MGYASKDLAGKIHNVSHIGSTFQLKIRYIRYCCIKKSYLGVEMMENSSVATAWIFSILFLVLAVGGIIIQIRANPGYEIEEYNNWA